MDHNPAAYHCTCWSCRHARDRIILDPNLYRESFTVTLELMHMRQRLETEPYVDVSNAAGRRMGLIRPGDEHQGPVRVTPETMAACVDRAQRGGGHISDTRTS